MRFNNRWIKNIIIFLVFIALIVFVFVMDKNVSSDNIISKAVSTVVSPISKLFRNVGTTIRSGVDSLSQNDKVDVEDLNLKIKMLEQENRKLSDIVQRSEALKKEYELVNNSNLNLIKANITSINANAWYDVFNVDVGIKDGVEMGDTVIVAASDKPESEVGLVGKVTAVFSNYSEISAITDDSVKASIRSIRSGDGGILTGMKKGELDAYMFDQNSDVIVGDEIITSGLGGVIKPNIYVGEVSKVETDETLLKKIIHITPGVDFKHLRTVYVVK